MYPRYFPDATARTAHRPVTLVEHTHMPTLNVRNDPTDVYLPERPLFTSVHPLCDRFDVTVVQYRTYVMPDSVNTMRTYQHYEGQTTSVASWLLAHGFKGPVVPVLLSSTQMQYIYNICDFDAAVDSNDRTRLSMLPSVLAGSMLPHFPHPLVVTSVYFITFAIPSFSSNNPMIILTPPLGP